MDFKDYYTTLGVSKTATDKEIKQAFRKLARKHHPDVNLGDKAAEAKFKELNEANEVLSDPQKRKKYDELGANWRAYENVPPGASPYAGGSPFGGQGGQWSTRGGTSGFRTMTEEDMANMFGGAGGESPFSDFFTTFFGGMGGAEESTGARGGRARPRARKGQDVEHPFELDLEDVIKGSVQRLQLRHDGHARTVGAHPNGVMDGSRVRIAGEGGRGSGSAPSGDSFGVQLKPHPVFDERPRRLYESACADSASRCSAVKSMWSPGIKDVEVESPAGRKAASGSASRDTAAERRQARRPRRFVREREVISENVVGGRAQALRGAERLK